MAVAGQIWNLLASSPSRLSWMFWRLIAAGVQNSKTTSSWVSVVFSIFIDTLPLFLTF